MPETVLAEATRKKPIHYLTTAQMFNLEHACALIEKAFPESYGIYLVGSATRRADYRDVDVRCMLPDDEFEKEFPGEPEAWRTCHPRWSLLSLAISAWLAQQTGLPIDFQFQKASVANAKHAGVHRQPLGIFLKFPDGA